MSARDNHDTSGRVSTLKGLDKPKSRTVPTEQRKVRSGPGTVSIVLLGLLIIGIGAAVQLGGQTIPELSQYVEYITRRGVEVSFYLAGLIVCLLGVISHFQRLHARTLLEPGVTDHALREVHADVVQLQHLMEDQQSAMIKSGLEVGFLRQELRDHREDNRISETKDALFRLAASLDQLGARIDQRIGVATAVLQDGMHEVSSLVEASRDYLQESIEETAQHFESYQASGHYGGLVVGPGNGAVQPAHAPAAIPVMEDAELEIEVELEDEHGSSLGLLDEMGDMHDYEEPIPPLPDGSTESRRRAE